MSKIKTKELDVDFIGGEGPLTKEEEEKISEYLRSKKRHRLKKQHSRRGTTTHRKKVSTLS